MLTGDNKYNGQWMPIVFENQTSRTEMPFEMITVCIKITMVLNVGN